MLILGGMSLSMLLGKPAAAQSKDKPAAVKKEKRQVHIKIIDDKDGKVRKIDTTFEVGPEFDMKAWMKANNFDVPDAPKGEEQMLIMKHEDGDGKQEEFSRMMINESDKIVIREFNERTPPCDPQDEECMLKWLQSDSVKHILKMVDPMKLPNGQDIIIIHDKDGKGGENKMVFSRIIVKKIEATPADGKEAKELKVEIFPNPSTGIFNIDVAVPGKTPAVLEITDKAGKVMYAEEVKSSGKVEVDLTAQGKGTYFVNLKQGKKTIQKQIMIN
jgi:hypothetical protein